MLVVMFLLGVFNAMAQRNYTLNQPSDYKSDTLWMVNYTYVCDTLPEAEDICLYNVENHPGREDMTYLNGEPLPYTNPWDGPDWYVITPEIDNKIKNIVNNAFTDEQVEMLEGRKFYIVFYISSFDGSITDVYFSFPTFSPYVNIPVGVFRQMEVEFKSNLVFELTDEGKRLTYCDMWWRDCPTTGRNDTPLTPDLPFDGGSGGEGNVQTGPVGSIISEPMEPPK